MNVNKVLTKNYEQMDTWSIRKNEPKTNPNEPKLKKAKMNLTVSYKKDYEKMSNWALYENEPNSKPIQSQNKPKQSQSLVKNSCARLWALLQYFSENFDKPGEQKAGCSARPKLRNNPMNLLGTMPAKEGKIDLKHSFCGSAFCFIVDGYRNYKFQKLTRKGNKNDRD